MESVFFSNINMQTQTQRLLNLYIVRVKLIFSDFQLLYSSSQKTLKSWKNLDLILTCSETNNTIHGSAVMPCLLIWILLILLVIYRRGWLYFHLCKRNSNVNLISNIRNVYWNHNLRAFWNENGAKSPTLLYLIFYLKTLFIYWRESMHK